MKSFHLLKNAAMLTATGFILRGLGMLLRIYISAKVGEEGMGVYQLISSVYFLFVTLAQSGIAVTVTRLCAQRFALGDSAGAYKTLKNSLAAALLTGIAACVLMLTFSGVISRLWIADARAVYAMRVLSLSLPFMAVCNVLSAFFIAEKNVVFGCTAQILEQITRMAAVVGAAVWFSNRGLSVMLAAVFAANTLSEAVSCCYLAIRFTLQKHIRPTRGGNGATVPVIIRQSAPVAASRYLASALHTAENMLVPSAIALYTHSRAQALSQFGALKGMALPLLFFPTSFLSAMSTLLVPEITAAAARRDRSRTERMISRAVGITVTLSVMTAGVFMLFSDGLGQLIYKSSNVSHMLFFLAPIVPFMYLDTICDGLLKGLGKQKQVLMHNCIDSGLRIILIALILPRFGIDGFLAVMVVSNILISVLNLRLLLSSSGVKCNARQWFFCPVCFAVISAIVTKFLFSNSANLTNILLGSGVFCAVFLLLTLFFGYFFKVYKNK